ncbi:FACT complex subunit SSRP1-like isoform X2 [Lycium ferocissimum]|uniref:FACT complex subunit SSRP1-like isoform X2 n=1 Tax=Lycium ferocissimum TaxID=112874 RepID=UPI002815446A|nr:FACT complex subunit SSRP1-like isoform X2 [Lycium ferocissimum]
MLAKTCLLQTNEGILREAKIIRENSNFFICEGDWLQFVVYHKLRPGEILLFLLIEKSTFLVVTYPQKSGKNLRGRQPFEELSSSSEEENEEDTEPSRNSKESSDSEEERADPSSCSKDGENPSYSHLEVKSNVKDDEMICLKKKVSELELSVSDLDNPKWPLGSFFVFMDKFKKRCLEMNPNIKSFDAVKKAGRCKWKRISDAEKSPYIAEAKKKSVEYGKVLDSYNWRMAAGYAEEGESVTPRSEFDPSNGSKDGENPCYSHLGD